MTADSELCFDIREVRRLAWHAVENRADDPPRLRLHERGPLVFLTSAGRPDLLLDPADPSSVQRVYARGRIQPTDAAHPVHTLGELPLWAADNLDDALRHAHGSRRWLAVTLTPTGLRWHVAAQLGRPPRDVWVDADMRLLGLGTFQGQYAEHDDWHGWCLARFPTATACAIAACANGLPRAALRHGLTRVRLTNQPTPVDGTIDATGALVVGPDSDGFYRIGSGRWQWTSLDLLERRERGLERFTDPLPDGDDPASVPPAGHLVHASDTLRWLHQGIVYERDYSSHHLWAGDQVTVLSATSDAPPRARAAEYLLRATSRRASRTRDGVNA